MSDEGLKRPLSDDILLFSEALIQSSAETKQLYSDHMTHGVSYLQNELDSIQSLKDKVQAMSLEKALDEKAEVNSQDSDDKVRILRVHCSGLITSKTIKFCQTHLVMKCFSNNHRQ